VAPRPLTPDLEGTVCAVADCLLVADVIGGLTVRVPNASGAMEELYTLYLSLCAGHASLLQTGGTGYTLAAPD
jgi:hypothetical protein